MPTFALSNIVITIKTNSIMKLNKSNQVEAISITVTKEKYPIELNINTNLMEQYNTYMKFVDK